MLAGHEDLEANQSSSQVIFYLCLTSTNNIFCFIFHETSESPPKKKEEKSETDLWCLDKFLPDR